VATARALHPNTKKQRKSLKDSHFSWPLIATNTRRYAGSLGLKVHYFLSSPRVLISFDSNGVVVGFPTIKVFGADRVPQGKNPAKAEIWKEGNGTIFFGLSPFTALLCFTLTFSLHRHEKKYI
jgi:hypothetical protein